MAAPRGKTVITAPQAKDPEAELPVVECFGLAQTPKGWVVVSVQVQGRVIVDQEVISEPEPLAHSAVRAQTEIVKAYVATKGRA